MAPHKFFIPPPTDLAPSGTSGPELLAIERRKASFSSQEMANYLYGQDFLERQQRIVDLLSNDPAFDKSRLPYLGRTDKFRAALRKDKRFATLAAEQGWDKETAAFAEQLADLPGPFGLHKSMFVETLENMGTDEQKEAFLKPALAYEIVGCYAQTELGHGSNVQGLETEAVYDESTQEFVLNSPSLTASKWWIGGLGRSATHAVVMAQMILKGKRVGPHPFVVPIRDPKTRKPLPGRRIGDIGPKMGYQTTDNGFLLLDHVRIPHFNQLSRFAKVDPVTAQYTPPPSSALTYGTLTWVRANIVQGARTVLMRSATVAVRYCAIRRQFADRDAPKFGENGKPMETQVLDYTMVQARVFPVLAKAFAFHYSGRAMFELYRENMKGIQEGDLSLLAETHASSSGLKALTTIEATDAIETCRRACGGHGFSQASGLSTFYQDYLPVTWEGDSYMLSQQTSRYLLKMMRQYKRDPSRVQKTFTRDYLEHYFAHKDKPAEVASFEYTGDLYNPMMFVKAFGSRAAFLIEQTLELRDGPAKRSWNSLLVDLYKCSKAHTQAFVIYNFAMAILKDDELNRRPALRTVVQQLFLLHATHTMLEEGAEFLSSGFLTPKQYNLLGTKVQELMAAIRPQAVPIVDSFAIPDYVLQSALGRSDGRVYESLFEFACAEPINAVDWNVDPHNLDELDIDDGGEGRDAVPRAKL